ncbi:MAG: CHAT domain-containing protein [Cyanobacteria bacterium J06621_11]
MKTLETQTFETQTLETTGNRNNTNDITDGIRAFEAGQFSAAIAHWQQALTSTTAPLSRAYLLSNLANAHQRLGETSLAQSTLAESLALIENRPDENRSDAGQSSHQAYWEVSARVLNTQGQIQWHQGQSAAALASWQSAESHYRKVSSQQSAQNSLLQTQINQALALQDLGFNAKAVLQLNQLSQQLPALPSSLQLTLARELGKAMRRVGEANSAKSLLTTALTAKAAPETESNTATYNQLSRAQIQLELGHTLRSLSHSAIALGEMAEANRDAELALSYYAQAASQPNSATNAATNQIALLRTQAQLNQLSYLIEIGRLSAAQAVWPDIELATLPVGRASTEAHVSYAHSLNCLRSPSANSCTKKEWQEGLTNSKAENFASATTADQIQTSLLQSLTTAIEQAKALSDPLMESYATGELGHAYELTKQQTEAIRLTKQALSLLEGKQMPEVSYRWEWQLGRLYRNSPQAFSLKRQATELLSQQKYKKQTEQQTERQTLSDFTQAISAYQKAIESLSSARQNLILVDPQVQFSFRDNVEPVYREFVSLLLDATQAGSNNTQPISQQNLKLAVKTLDALQLTELENFLGCDLSQVVTLSTTGTDPNAVKIYPIVLPRQLAIIIEPPNQPLVLKTIEVSQPTIEETLTSLRENLTLPGKTPAVLTAASQLYDWLIAPIESVIENNQQIETLVFVPDGLLRNVPMGVLYDGQQYLVEKDYAIAIAPQLDLFAPRRAPEPLKILRGGIGLPQIVRGQTFPPIELIQAELDQIPNELTVSKPLLNEAFTQSNIEEQLASETYSAIHWKTHGVFSSDPGETFLVAYQDGITANELSTLVRSASEQQSEPLELLVLSACETAQGDRRAVLGLAGIAVRAGTRSTLSTLWRADDGANTELMASFYQGLETGLTKAQSLQQAQKKLLSEIGYPAPYYWAPYVLVGNWL